MPGRRDSMGRLRVAVRLVEEQGPWYDGFRTSKINCAIDSSSVQCSPNSVITCFGQNPDIRYFYHFELDDQPQHNYVTRIPRV